jgi:hypothetical protein
VADAYLLAMSSLCGKWRLKKRGSDYVPGVEDIAGVPFISQMIDESFGLTISQLTKPMEEISIEHEHLGRRKTAFYQMGKTSFEDVTASTVILAAVVHISEEFTELSILRMGPEKGQRRYTLHRFSQSLSHSLEQYKLNEIGNEIRVEIDHVLPEGQAIKLVKRLERLPSPPMETIIFTNTNVVNHWALPQSHSPSTLRAVSLRIVDVLQVVTEGATARRKQANLESDERGSMIRKSSFSNSPPGSPSASMRRASLMHQNSGIVSLQKSVRRFKNELSVGETIQLYVIEVRVPLWLLPSSSPPPSSFSVSPLARSLPTTSPGEPILAIANSKHFVFLSKLSSRTLKYYRSSHLSLPKL